jgi:hypothetical protein
MDLFFVKSRGLNKMSGPTNPDDDYMSAEAILDSLFPAIYLRGPPPTEEELQKTPEILPPEMKMSAGARKDYNEGGEIVNVFFNIRDQIKLYHWQTMSFSEHKSTDELVKSLDTNIDKFVEVYMGRYGRPYINETLRVKNLTVSGIRTFIKKSSDWLAEKLPSMLKKTDTDLLNIRDEMLSNLNQVKYLLTLV